jgi:hypothetical protein
MQGAVLVQVEVISSHLSQDFTAIPNIVKAPAVSAATIGITACHCSFLLI